MRRPVIAGNWKLFKTIGEATTLVNDLKVRTAGITGVDIIVAPVFTALSSVATATVGSNIRLAAQNCFWEESGAYTGEVSASLLKDAGCSHVIIGHSERRQYFAETDATVNRKIHAASAAGLTVIACVGETLTEREAEQTFVVIETQLQGALAGLRSDAVAGLIIAYEPVWAIGTGKSASEAQAQEVHAFIRSLLERLFGLPVATAVRILYGGSVKPETISGLMSQPDIDGALVGGASLSAESFAAIAGYSA
ncbi:MAG TPA: triose-phosphate isomerase [Desulfuromonadales bacterium]|nr:triose-phosphate isomerase [Desulfuromonadales bacterium]